MTTWYHASPSVNRASILARGLLGTRTFGDGTASVFAIPGQMHALYLVPTLAEVHTYAEHVFDRWFPDAVNPFYARQYLERGARLASFDIWAVEVAGESLSPDTDWPGSTAVWTKTNFPPDRLRLIEATDLVDRRTRTVR